MRICALALIALGLVVSGHLLSRHFALAADGADGLGPDFCSALFGTDCDDALRSPLSEQLGLPLAGWGIVYYGTLAVLLLLGWCLGKSFDAEATLAALVLAAMGAAISLALAASFASGAVPLCPLCAVMQAINLVLPIVLWRQSGRSPREHWAGLTAAGRYVCGVTASDPGRAPLKVVCLLTAALAAVVLYQWVWIEAVQVRPTGPAPFDAAAAVNEFELETRHEIPRGDADPALGPLDAPIQLTLFSDFECPACRRLATQIRALADRHGGRIRIVFKHFPLSSDCNPAIQRKLHPNACQAAWAAEAARRQGRFWDYHDAVLAARLRPNPSQLTSVAADLGLDTDRFAADRQDEAVRARVSSDIDLGRELGVDGTPTLFLDGRRVRDFRPEALNTLIGHLLIDAPA